MKLRNAWIIVSALLAGSAYAQSDPQRDFVATAKDAYLMFPPDFICGPKVREMLWSGDGERLVVVRDFEGMTPSNIHEFLLNREKSVMPVPEAQVLIWSAVTGKVTTVMKLKSTDGQLNRVQWMPGTSQLVVMGSFGQEGPDKNETSFLMVSSTGAIRNVAHFDNSLNVNVDVSPYTSTAALTEYPPFVPRAAAVSGQDALPVAPQPSGTVRFFGADGVLGPVVQLPGPHSYLFFSRNTQTYAFAFLPKKTGKGFERHWYVFNRASKKFESATVPVDSAELGEPPTAAAPELIVEDLPAQISGSKVGIKAPTVIVSAPAIKDAEPSVVSTDGKQGQLSPKLVAVSYIDQGSAMVRPMAKVPLEVFKQAKLAALKTRLISQAKQVALAVIMHAGDNDDNYISNKGDWKTALYPYAKNNSLFDGFNLTFAGGSATGIESPATTELGYIDGPGGRAVAYTDGHVRWIPNP